MSKAVSSSGAKVLSMASARTRLEIATKIQPLEDRLVVHVQSPSTQTAGGLYIPDSVSEKPTRGKVLGVGRGLRSKKGKIRPMDVKVGDWVLFSPYAGTQLQFEGHELLILREEEVLGILNSQK